MLRSTIHSGLGFEPQQNRHPESRLKPTATVWSGLCEVE